MAHILVIEDDEQFRNLLELMLGEDGHEVKSASDGQKGLEYLQRNNPDLVITDILMPSMDGIELIMRLKELGNTIPIIAMSGGRRSISAEFNLESATLMGVKDNLIKPFTREQLRQSIKKVLF